MEVVLNTKCCTHDTCEHVIHTLIRVCTHMHNPKHTQAATLPVPLGRTFRDNR